MPDVSSGANGASSSVRVEHEAVCQAFDARIESADARLAMLSRQIKRLELARLVVFLALPTLLYHGYETGFDAWVMSPFMLCLVGFVWLVRRHARLRSNSEHARHLRALNQDALARTARDFSALPTGRGETLDGLDKQDLDINLYGPGSLGQLLFNQSTHLGDARIKAWFAHPAPLAERQARQQAIGELRPLLDHRQALGAHARTLTAKGYDLGKLLRWIAAESLPPIPRTVQALGYGLTGLTLLCGLGVGLSLLPPMLLMGCVVANVLFYALCVRPLHKVFEGADDNCDALGALVEWMECCARTRYHSPMLAMAQARLFTEGKGPVSALRQLASVLGYAGLRHNATLSVFAQVALNWDFHTALAVSRWRRTYRAHLPDWLEAMAEIECACAFAQLAYENPAWTFPSESTDCRIVGTEVRHPLIPASRAIANDVDLQPGRVVIITGSNMSGKTTYMRAIALNLRLAQVGSVVAASAFRFVSAKITSSISVADSLEKGLSYFMSEVAQVRDVIETAKTHTPVVFLLDELLKGTNEKERNIAIVEILQTLCAHQAMGLLTTHNVALATDSALAGCARNIYFEEALTLADEPALRFTYRLKEGVSQNTNAIRLLRSMGVLE
ncbi:MutS-related protein [Pseudomonas phoenicis]|uniref:MutS-related protein n=1 Tax=unclassified Pseudomonas TaxID=196821 RepID=UPI0039A01B58